ncbi:MAG: ThiF family adenylyltransferase [Pseudomonadota bacterium]
MNYDDLFDRNYGVLTREQQERLHGSDVLIVGCGGIGGTVAIILARSGVGRFTLVDPDTYEPTNMNRQIGCFKDTLGRNKAEVVREDILRINPEARVEAHGGELPFSEIERLAAPSDLVFPAADDYAYSIMVFRRARKLRKPALMIVPAGLWSIVTIIRPSGPTVEDIHGVPPVGTYRELKEIFETRKYKLATLFYTTLGGWRKEYYRDFIESGLPPAQICPVVWLASSAGALEAVKLLSGKEKPVAAPWYWLISKDGIRKQHIRRPGVYSLLVLQRKIFWKIFQSPLGGLSTRLQALWWDKWFNR